MSGQVSAEDLLLILTIAEAGTLARAAEQMFSTAPSISRSLRAVEQRVGSPVFERHRRGISPTPVGAALLAHGRTIRAASAQANRDATVAIDSTKRTELLVGIAQKVSVATAASAVEAARSAGQNTRVTLNIGSQDSLLAALDNGEIDIMIGTVPAPAAHRTVETLFEDRPVISCRYGHRLTTQKSVTVADLANEHWVLPQESDPLRQRINGLFADSGLLPPDPSVVTDDVLLAATLALTSDLITVLPANAVIPQFGPSPVHILNVPITGRNDEIGIIRRRGQKGNASTEAFINALRNP
jgi:DNA-binding transcriptional LysR family regulator